MLSPETAETARTWYETGVKRILSDSIGTGIAHLERAVAVFASSGETRLLAYARHYVLLGLKLNDRFDEAEALYPDILDGYAALGDTYGRALLICHLAEIQADQGRWQRAHSLFNLACVVAENDQHRDVVVHVLEQQGQLCRERDDLTRALRHLERADRLLEGVEPPGRQVQLRYMRAQTLAQLGETAEAIALLEDVQTHLVRAEANHAAIEPLVLLRRLYADEGQPEEEARIARLMNLSGQRIIQADAVRRTSTSLGPPIDPSL